MPSLKDSFQSLDADVVSEDERSHDGADTAKKILARAGKLPRATPIPAEPPVFTPPPPSPDPVEAAAPAKERARPHTTWLYPSDKARVDVAHADYTRRHPNDKLSKADIYRMALEDVPPEGTKLDEWIRRHRNA